MDATISLLIFLMFAGCASLDRPQRASTQLEWVGEASLAHGLAFERTQIGGLSGLYYDQSQKELVAISDDPGMEPARGPGRFYHFDLEIGNHSVKVSPKRVTLVNGFRIGATDFEAIAPIADGWLISLESETDKMNQYKAGDLSAISRPRLLKTNARGRVTKEYLLPPRFQPGTKMDHGVALNAGVEGITPIFDGFLNAQWAMMTEAPLIQDQPRFPLCTRLTLFSLGDGPWQDAAEFVYPFSPVVKDVGFAATTIDRGVSDILYLGEGRIWVLERSFYFNHDQNVARNIIEIFEVDLSKSSAASTHAADQLSDAARPLPKRLVASLDDFIDRMPTPTTPVGHILDNVEGMTLGPKIDGHDSLILVTDDNFRVSQRTLFRVFKIVKTISHAMRETTRWP